MTVLRRKKDDSDHIVSIDSAEYHGVGIHLFSAVIGLCVVCIRSSRWCWAQLGAYPLSYRHDVIRSP